MRIAYADPPYPGQAKKHYGPAAREVNHQLLIDWLDRDFDAWALSTTSVALFDLIPLCPAGVRIGAWVKPFASFKKGVDPAYAWEPVIYKSARKWNAAQMTARDWVSVEITLRRGTAGAKPAKFCYWLFDLLGCDSDTDFVDVFPGSGAVQEAWDAWSRQMTFCF
jgi:hypothetical protein